MIYKLIIDNNAAYDAEKGENKKNKKRIKRFEQQQNINTTMKRRRKFINKHINTYTV